MAISVSSSAREVAMPPDRIVSSGDICPTLTLVHVFSATGTWAGHESNLCLRSTPPDRSIDILWSRYIVAFLEVVSGNVGLQIKTKKGRNE